MPMKEIMCVWPPVDAGVIGAVVSILITLYVLLELSVENGCGLFCVLPCLEAEIAKGVSGMWI